MSPVQVYNAPDQKIGQKKLKHLSDTLKVVQTNCKSHEDTSPNGVAWQVPKFSYPPTLSNNKNLKDHFIEQKFRNTNIKQKLLFPAYCTSLRGGEGDELKTT